MVKLDELLEGDLFLALSRWPFGGGKSSAQLVWTSHFYFTLHSGFVAGISQHLACCAQKLRLSVEKQVSVQFRLTAGLAASQIVSFFVFLIICLHFAVRHYVLLRVAVNFRHKSAEICSETFFWLVCTIMLINWYILRRIHVDFPGQKFLIVFDFAQRNYFWCCLFVACLLDIASWPTPFLTCSKLNVHPKWLK